MKLLGWYGPSGFLWSQCDHLPSYNHHMLCLMVKGLWSMLQECNPKFKFLHDFFLKNSNQICTLLPNLRSLEEKCMKFRNFNWELFLKPRCTHAYTKMWTRYHDHTRPMKYDHAWPWSSRLNPTINIMFGNDRSGCEASFLKSCQTHCFRSQWKLVQVTKP